jgi:CHAT domain-containing protein/tetratricopeptide (TPR) repeat protein
MSMRVRIISPENYLRTRALIPLCVASLLMLGSCTRAPDDPRTEYAAEFPVDGAHQAGVARSLSAGSYLVEIEERGIDLRLVVDAPGMHQESEDAVPRHGLLHQIVSLPAPGELRIALRSADHSTMQGGARVRLARWQRAADQPPGERESGYLALAAAGVLTAQKEPAAGQQAADKLHEAMSHFDAADSVAERAQAEYALANLLFWVRDEYASAMRAADQAAGSYDDVDDDTGVQSSSALRAAAEIQLAAGMDAGKQPAEQAAMYEDADRRLGVAAEFFKTHDLPLRAAFAVSLRGIRALNVGDYGTAGKYFAQALEMSRASHDARTEAISLANLAWVHNRQGFIAQAASEYEDLLPMIEKETQAYQYAAAVGNLGFCLIALGDFDRALAMHNEALALYTSQGKELERATALAALGGLYFRIGDTQRALDILRAAIAAQERVGDALGQASSLRVAGNAASTLGQHEEALAFLRRSAQIDANPQSATRTRVLIAGELRALGDLRGAEAELAQALESGNALVHANALEERARLRNAQKDFPAAIADLRAADREYLDLGLEFNRIETNTALSRALLASRDLPGASAAADEAVSITGRIRAKSANPEWRAFFLSSRYAPYEARIAADLALGGPDAAWQSFRTAELVRARSLSDQLAFGRGSRTADADTDALRAKLTSLQLRLETRVQRGANDAGTAELRTAIAQTRAQLDANGDAVEARAAGLSGTEREVRAGLPRETAVLAYFVGDVESHAWLLTRDGLRHKRLPGLARLQHDIDAALDGRNFAARPSEALQDLADTLLGGLLEGVTASRMLVIPDGSLNGVPFAALPVARSSTELLVDRYVLGYAPSLSLAMNTSRGAAPRHTRVAVVSDPVYAPDDRRLQLAMGTNGGTLRGPRETSPNNLTRLPYSALEARAVLHALGSKDTIALDGFDATPAHVLALSSQPLGVLHFATHAMARRDAPENSALYLSEYAADGTFVPNSRITVGEIARTGLRADVVVLSGCATGDGGELRGEGVLGLTYGFLANGSRAVVASLWPIEDASTARFMSEFYGAYRSAPQPAEALRRAQLRTRGSAATAAWASFVVRANGFP